MSDNNTQVPVTVEENLQYNHRPPAEDSITVENPFELPPSTARATKDSSIMICRPNLWPNRFPIDIELTDEILVQLTVREMNIRLHGMSRKEVLRYKQRRLNLRRLHRERNSVVSN